LAVSFGALGTANHAYNFGSVVSFSVNDLGSLGSINEIRTAKFLFYAEPSSPCTMSDKRGADQVAEGDEELGDAIRKKVKVAHEEFQDDKEEWEVVLMVHPSPYPLVSRTSI
jgi:hypothetical protein